MLHSSILGNSKEEPTQGEYLVTRQGLFKSPAGIRFNLVELLALEVLRLLSRDPPVRVCVCVVTMGRWWVGKLTRLC